MTRVTNFISANTVRELVCTCIPAVDAFVKKFGEKKVSVKNVIPWLKKQPEYRDFLVWALSQRTDVTKALIKAGADISIKKGDCGNTALHEAALSGKQSIVRLLLNKGVDPTVVNYNGHTAWELAIRYHHRDLAEMLQEAEKEWRRKHLPKGHFLVANFPLRRISGR